MTLTESVLSYVRYNTKHELVIDPAIVVQLLTAAREASDAHLSVEQHKQLDEMIAAVLADIIT